MNPIPRTSRAGRCPPLARCSMNPAIQDAIVAHSRPLALDAIHRALERMRAGLKNGEPAPARAQVVVAVLEELDQGEMQRIRPVVNATGIILHTGLGRAVLAQSAVDALAGANRCVNLQIDLETGAAGEAPRHVRGTALQADRGGGRAGGGKQRPPPRCWS